MFLSHFDKMDRYSRSTHSFQRQKWEHELVSDTRDAFMKLYWSRLSLNVEITPQLTW